MTIAKITVRRLAPDSDTSAIASKIAGIAINPSMIRMITASAHRKYPAIKPINSPIAMLEIATDIPTIRDTRAP